MKNLPPLPTVAQLRPVGAGAGVLTRRNFLVFSGASLISMSLLPVSSALAAPSSAVGSSDQSFNQLCSFLTDKELKLSLTHRAFVALSKVDSDFASKAQALTNVIKNGSYTSIETLKFASELKGEVRQTALDIISSLYMGYTGIARPDHAEDNTEFVTYTEALMYRLTYHYTPIPSYSRWSTGYWTSIPK